MFTAAGMAALLLSLSESLIKNDIKRREVTYVENQPDFNFTPRRHLVEVRVSHGGGGVFTLALAISDSEDLFARGLLIHGMFTVAVSLARNNSQRETIEIT